MPILSQSSSNWMLSLKVVLLSTGVLSMAVMLKLSVPVITEFAICEVPPIWSFVVSWLRPPYLYLVINCIIIIIVASSKFQQKVDDSPPETVLLPVPIKITGDAYDDVYTSPEVRPGFGYGYDANIDVKATSSGSDVYSDVNWETKTTMNVNALDQEMNESHDELAISRSSTPNKSSTEYSFSTEKPLVSARFGHRKAVKASPPEGNGDVNWETKTMMNVNALDQDMNESHDELAISRSSAPNKSSTEYSLSTEKPLVSARFGHRKAVKASPPEGGRTLGVVSKPKRHDTLEATWKTITDGRPMPLTRHLRKSDTWETPPPPPPPPRHITDQKMTKSETFTVNNNSSLSRSSGSGKLRREASPSQDELNRRVEAFIKKFNDDMRLQRQESLNQYMEMINRGAH